MSLLTACETKTISDACLVFTAPVYTNEELDNWSTEHVLWVNTYSDKYDEFCK